MAYDDRSVKPMSASLMRARIATKILSGLYEDVPTLLTSAIRLMVELPGGSANSGPPYPFTIGVSPAWCSGLNGAKLVASGKLDLVWLNPSIIPSMAVRGVGPFRRKYPLRALAVFPSWDRLVIAVSPKLGVSTMEELIEKKPKMNVSIAVNDCVDFAIKTLLKAHGISQRDFIKWGGTVDEVVRPSNPHRRDGIVSGDVHMVIDEGMDSWGDVAVAAWHEFFVLFRAGAAETRRSTAFNARGSTMGGSPVSTNRRPWSISAAGRSSFTRSSLTSSPITSPACWIRFVKKSPTMPPKPHR